MAQVSGVTAATREVAERGATAVILNPSARQFLPWWRLGGSMRPLSADAPEFVMAAQGSAPAGAGGNAIPNIIGTGRRRVARNNWQDAGAPRAGYKPRRPQWQEAVKRTIFVTNIDHSVTEEMLAALFGIYGIQVVDYRIYGDTTSGLQFALVELQSEDEAYAALFLDGSIIGVCPMRISLSRTAICPINPRFLPESEAEWEMCSRTVYCSNISKIVKQCNLKGFCEAYFGKVCRLKLLGDARHGGTSIAFIEFAEVRGAIAALNSSGICAGGIRTMRVSPSKTPIKSCGFEGSPVSATTSAETN